MEFDYCENDIESAKHQQYTGGNFDAIKGLVPLPLICRCCGGLFCDDHKLLAAHNCIGLLDNNKFHISDELKKDIMDYQEIDVPQSNPDENRTPNNLRQYMIEKQKASDNSKEVEQEIRSDTEKTIEQNTNAVRCDFCGEDISKCGNKKGKYYTGGTKDINYKPIQLPFKCHRCKGTFCVNHRLPESHRCTGSYRKHIQYSVDKKTSQESYVYHEHQRHSVDKTSILIVMIIIATLVALYIILSSN